MVGITPAVWGCALGALLLALSAGAQAPNTDNARSPIGTNLAEVADWSTEYPFVDHMKMARPFFSASAGAWEDGRPLQLDADGNVKSLLPGQYARTVLFTGTPADPGLAQAQFVVLYRGSGSLEYGNVDVLSRAPGRDVVRLRGSADSPGAELTLIITLTATRATNPLRALRVVPAGAGICAGDPFTPAPAPSACGNPARFRSFEAHHASILFNPQFLQGLRRYRAVRFMDWQRTNNAPALAWAARARPSHQFYSTDKGVPLEVMVALANTLSAHPWFCIPHAASDAYVYQFAGVIKWQLAAGLRAHIEYSNEVWNGMFEQTRWALERGAALGLDADRYTAMAKFYSLRAQQAFAIFEAVFTQQPPRAPLARIRRVMATQAVVPYFTQQIMAFRNARQLTDLFAIAPYFGTTLTSAEQAAEVKRLGSAGLLAWLASGPGSNAVLGYGSLGDVDAAVAAQLAVLQPLGIPLGSYEGGQHMVGAGGLAWDEELQRVLAEANRSPAMKAVYLRYLAAWRQRTGQPLMHFVHCGRWSPWGLWGAQEYPSQPRGAAPKLDALLEFAATAPLDPA